MKQFDIPVCLFIFQRTDTVMRIIARIAEVKPQKIYLISDQGRNDVERNFVTKCRTIVENAISWPCDIVRDYATENRGVFGNIGLGSLRVFEKEERAIFLEDDNLPEISFFFFCKEMLERYQDNDRVLWICGTNYLGRYDNVSDESYMFTQHLLPCGWASWRGKYTKYYDKYFDNYSPIVLLRIRAAYQNKALYKQQLESMNRERNRYLRGERFRSWDFQMNFSVRANDLVGISPVFNQIKNIGVDAFSEHGGSSFDSVMTKRFCGMESYPLSFPLNHPKTVLIDPEYEKKIGKLILYPIDWRVRKIVVNILRKTFPFLRKEE